MTERKQPLHARALCRGCGRTDQVVVIDALAATTEAWVGGERVPFAAASEAPQRWTIIFCSRCNRVLGRPVLRTATDNAAVCQPGTSQPGFGPGTTDDRRLP